MPNGVAAERKRQALDVVISKLLQSKNLGNRETAAALAMTTRNSRVRHAPGIRTVRNARAAAGQAAVRAEIRRAGNSRRPKYGTDRPTCANEKKFFYICF